MRASETFKVGSHTIEWSVDRSGKFNCKDPQGYGILVAPSLDALKKKARTAYSALGKIAIPVTLYIEHDEIGPGEPDEREPEFRGIELIGLHAIRDRVIYRNEDGEAVTNRGYSDVFMKRLTDAEQAELKRLMKAKKEAAATYERYKKSKQIDERALIEEALRNLANGTKETADAD